MTPRTRTRLTLAASLLAVAMVASWPARAASQTGAGDDPITAEMVAVKVLEDPKGREVYVTADEARPGDLIEYRVTYSNRGKALVRKLQATLPLPVGVDYQPETAWPQGVEARTETDGFDVVPLRKVVRNADGSREVLTIPADEYRALRWTIPELRAGATVQVKARARVATAQ